MLYFVSTYEKKQIQCFFFLKLLLWPPCYLEICCLISMYFVIFSSLSITEFYFSFQCGLRVAVMLSRLANVYLKPGWSVPVDVSCGSVMLFSHYSP